MEKKYIILKATKQEQQRNSNTLERLKLSVVGKSALPIKHILKEDGIYMGKTKLLFLAWMNTLFAEAIDLGTTNVQFKEGIAMDGIPGAVCLEINFVNKTTYIEDLNDDPIDEIDVLKKVRLAISFDAGQINRIARCSRFIEHTAYEEDMIQYSLN